MATKLSWRQLSGNQVLDGDGFYISYRGSSSNIGGFGLPMLDALFAGDNDGGAETALVKKNGKERSTFYVLNGDFRKQYESLVPDGFDACLRFYNQESATNRSSWSEDKKALTK